MRLREFSNVSKTLYVNRPLINGDELRDWARKQGFASMLPLDELHTTIAFSKKKVDWSLTEPDTDEITIESGDRHIEALGDKGAVVLRYESEELKDRWQFLCDEVGCSWDFPDYKCHVSITYDGLDLDLEGMEAYDGPLIFGPEEFEELDDDFVNSLVEDKLE